MSHLAKTTGNIPVSQADLLVQGLKSLGLNPEVGAALKVSSYYMEKDASQVSPDCQVVIRWDDIKQALGDRASAALRSTWADIGFADAGNGYFELVTDQWCFGTAWNAAQYVNTKNGQRPVSMRQLFSMAYARAVAESTGGKVTLGVDGSLVMRPAKVEAKRYGRQVQASRSKYIHAS